MDTTKVAKTIVETTIVDTTKVDTITVDATTVDKKSGWSVESLITLAPMRG